MALRRGKTKTPEPEMPVGVLPGQAPFGTPFEPREPEPAPEPTVKEKPKKEPKPKKEKPEKNVASNVADRAWPGPMKPSAVLVPQYVRDRRAAQRTLRTMLFLVLGVMLVTVCGLAFAFLSAQKAENDALNAKIAEEGAQRKVDALAPVAIYYDGLVARQQTAIAAMKPDLDYTGLLNGVFKEADQANVGISAVDVAPTGTICEGPNPFRDAATIGCLNITIDTTNLDKASAFIDGLNDQDDLFNSAFATGFAQAAESGSLNVTVNFTPKALSLKYVPEDQRDQVIAEYTPQIDPFTGQIVVPAPATATTAPGTTPAPVAPTPTPAG